MTDALESRALRFKAADFTSSRHNRLLTEGRISRANDKLPSPQKLLAVLRHCARSWEAEQTATSESLGGPNSVEAALRESPVISVKTPDVAGTSGVLMPFTPLITALQLTATGAISISGPMIQPGSGSVVAPIATTPIQATGWLDLTTFLSGGVPNIGAGPREFWLTEETWCPPVFASGAGFRLLSEAGNETNIPTKEDIREMESGDFLDGIYAYVASGRTQTAIVSVIDYVDRLLNDGLFRVCDALLAQADLTRMPSSIRRAFLMVTKPAKKQLPTRVAFYDDALRLLSRERGEEKARKMLKSLQ